MQPDSIRSLSNCPRAMTLDPMHYSPLRPAGHCHLFLIDSSVKQQVLSLLGVLFTDGIRDTVKTTTKVVQANT